MLEGLRGEQSIAELCRREGINANLYYRWSKQFLEAGKQRLAGDTDPEATCDEEKQLRSEAAALKKAPAVTYMDEQARHVSESTVYRLLKARDLTTSPAYILMEASDQFQHPTQRVNEMWQTDCTYCKVTGWGWYYLSTVQDDYSRFILAWRLCTTISAQDVQDTLDEALASFAEEPDPAGAVLLSLRTRGGDRTLRGSLQQRALPRVAQQLNASGRVLGPW